MGCSSSVGIQRYDKISSKQAENGTTLPKVNETKENVADVTSNAKENYDAGALRKCESVQLEFPKSDKELIALKRPSAPESEQEIISVPSQPLTQDQVAVENALTDLRQSLFGNVIPTVKVEFVEDKMDTITGRSSKSDTVASVDGSSCTVAVIDAGTGFCKAGLMGEDIPSVVIPTVIGRQKDGNGDETFIGKDAKLRRDLLRYSQPITRGVVTNWSDMEKVYDHILHMDLNLEPNEFGVALPEPPHSTRGRREEICQMMFEKFNVRKLYLGSSSSLALNALGINSGLVVSMGHGVCHAVPILQGNAVNNACRTTQIGSEDLVRQMQSLINLKHKLHIDEDIARSIVERTNFVKLDRSEQCSETKIPYTLPNGRCIELQEECLSCPEIFFDPYNTIGADEKSVVEICRESLKAVAGEKTASELQNNIILIGGPSLLPGICDRLRLELSHNSLFGGEIRVLALPKRQYAAWLGTSMLASLNSSKNRWLEKSQYEEHGANIIHRKYL